jgi:hypothetical protein
MPRGTPAAALAATLLLVVFAAAVDCREPAPPRYLRHEAFRLSPGASPADTLRALALEPIKMSGSPPLELCAVVGRVKGLSFLTERDVHAEDWQADILSMFLEGDSGILVTLEIEAATTGSERFNLHSGMKIKVPTLFLATPLGLWDNPARRRPEIRNGDRIACMLAKAPEYGRDMVLRTGSVLLLPDERAPLPAEEAVKVERLIAVYRRAALSAGGGR